MKIGIITQPLGTNYGGILQNYALQEVLRRIGHEPITLRIGKRSWLLYYKACISVSILKLLGRKLDWPESPKGFGIRTSGMELFVTNNLSTTSWIRRYKLSDINNFGLNVFIVGSDQVWRPMMNPNLSDMFLTSYRTAKIKRIAYAASFGTSKWEFSQKQEKECCKLMRLFDAVSMREQSGVKLCKEHLRRDDVKWVLDPTMLLTKNDYIELCKDIPQRKEPFLFVYMLDTNEERMKSIKAFAVVNGWKVLYKTAGADITQNDFVEDWLSIFRDASYVITDSFHGTVFSLIHHVQFTTFYNSLRGNARFETLIKLFPIANRFLDEYSTIVFCEDEPNWSDIDSKMLKNRKTSLDFLERAMK